MSTVIVGFMVVTLIIIWVGLFLWCFLAWIGECGGRIISTALCVIVNSVLVGGLIEHEQKNPCVQYEERMSYNAATKTMMPMRVCVERGEWVEQ